MFWDLVFSKHGYFVFQKEKQTQHQLVSDIKQLEAEKEKLQQAVIRLREDPKALEEVIHRELGYVYPDETMIIMPKAASTKPEDKRHE